MQRGTEVTLSFPPLSGLVRKLILINSGVYLAMLVLGVVSLPLRRDLYVVFGLVPAKVLSGWLWQVVTYAFLHSGLFHLIYNMFALWMFGTELESVWGRRRFLQLYFVSLIGAAVVTVGMGLAGVLVSMSVPTVGASGAAYGILAAYAAIFGERRIIVFPLPIPLKAKHWVRFLVFLSLIGALEGGGGVAHMAHLGGLLFGYLYVVFVVRRSPGASLGDGLLGLRNAWYRWKRRRAGKKFEVYMRQFENQPEEETDPNTLPPGKKNGEHRGPWIN
ncbi:MAG: rhomboid family intramembrane serine protease [Terriglobales bacterium]